MKHSIIATMTLAVMAMVSCSEVDLCYEDEHPHTGAVTYDFNWGSSTLRPDSMGIVAYRVINTWRRMMIVSTDTKRGHYEDGSSLTRQAANDSLAADTAATDTVATDTTAVEPQQTDLSRFSIRTGEYKFVTFSIDTAGVDASELKDFLKLSKRKTLQDCHVEYVQYDRTDARLKTKIAGWEDYNAYAKYIQPDASPIYYDSVAMVKVEKGQTVACKFSPQPITQNVDVYFTITKKVDETPFAIDSVWAEIAGVPRKINIATGNLDITKTNKMMFKMDLVDSDGKGVTDTGDNKSLRCHGNIDVTGIVNCKSTSLKVGPGILQIIIYTHTTPTDGESEQLVKKLQGEINLYNTINKAKPITVSADGETATRNGKHVTLDIKTNLVINSKTIVDSPDNNGGLDRWIATGGDTVVDI